MVDDLSTTMEKNIYNQLGIQQQQKKMVKNISSKMKDNKGMYVARQLHQQQQQQQKSFFLKYCQK
ncbi:hypothetical protein DERP_001744 [Dermatophagoides pteronyssinus]|uniref:Uncharacterized protein n=1 Tax=Dermatophagoides pteronyssinus TaxID=6956 RepID=A0ABQ8JBD7_DERPT|nr:hypothetical protein DERP_001744 [Dermatophagoides pteronyssinus]